MTRSGAGSDGGRWLREKKPHIAGETERESEREREGGRERERERER